MAKKDSKAKQAPSTPPAKEPGINEGDGKPSCPADAEEGDENG